MGASESLDDVPHRLRLSSYPADRPRDLYESLIRTLGIIPRIFERQPLSSAARRPFVVISILKSPGLTSTAVSRPAVLHSRSVRHRNGVLGIAGHGDFAGHDGRFQKELLLRKGNGHGGDSG